MDSTCNTGHGTNQVWPLLQYGKYEPQQSKLPNPSSTLDTESWKNFDATNHKKMNISITSEGHMLVLYGNSIMESINLPTAGGDAMTWKIFRKGGVLCFLNNIQEQSRMFRIQFKTPYRNSGSAEAACKQCADRLSVYFALRNTTDDNNKENEIPMDQGIEIISEPDIKTLASQLLGKNNGSLISIYKELVEREKNIDISESQQSTETFIRLCLSDPTFPSFVGQVESVLETMQLQK